MRMRNKLGLLLLLAMVAAPAAVMAQSAANGEVLFTTPIKPGLLTCAGCHGNPPPSTMNASLLPTAIASNFGGYMGNFSFLSSSQIADLEAYISNPSAASVPVVALSPTTLSFGNQQVGTTSAAQTVTLQNTGGGALTLSVATAAPFAQTNNCGASVAAGASCTISVTFAPTGATASSGSLSLTDNATGSPQTVALSGTGTPAPAPAASVTPTMLAFGSVTVGSTSAAQSVTLSNTGNAPLSVSSLSVAAPFAQTNTCGSSVAAGASCTINITYTPTAIGAASGTLTIGDNATGSPQTVALSGTGAAAPAPAVGLAPTSLTFASQQVNTTSAAQSVTLSNTGNATLMISGITASSPFKQSDTCGASLATGASCTISVTFAPTTTGSFSGTVTITDSAAGSPHAVALSGTAAPAPAPAVTLSAANLSFGNQVVGTTSAPQTLTVTNSGTGTLNLASISVSGAFNSPGGTCSTSSGISAGASCTIQVVFAPTTAGTLSGLITITDNASGSPRTVTLQGTGTTTTAGSPTLMPTSLTFAAQPLNTTSAPQTLTLTNAANAPALTISGVAATGADPSDFAVSSNCPSTLSPGASCAVQVSFKPTMAGTRTATVAVTSSAAGPLSATVTGTGLAPSAAVLAFNTSTLTFGNVAVGSTSWPKWLSLSNTGTATLHITGVSITGDFTKIWSSCGSTLAPRAHCGYAIAFKPTALGVRAGKLTVTSDTSGSVSSVALTGTGVTSSDDGGGEGGGHGGGGDPTIAGSATGTTSGSAVLSTSTTQLQFDATKVGSTSAPLTTLVTNTGPAAASVKAVTVNGTGFQIAADACSGKTLMSGASCAVSVSYAPSQSGAGTGQLSVAGETGAAAQTALRAQALAADATSTTSGSTTSGGGGAIGIWSLLALAAAQRYRRRGKAEN